MSCSKMTDGGSPIFNRGSARSSQDDNNSNDSAVFEDGRPSRDKFTLVVPQEEWADVAIVGSTTRRWLRNHIPLLTRKMSEKKCHCVLVFKINRVKKDGSRNKSAPWFTGMAICKYEGCHKFAFKIKREPNATQGVKVKVQVTGKYNHSRSAGEGKRRNVAGKERDSMQEELKKKGASNVFYDNMGKADMDDVESGNHNSLPSKACLRQMLHEVIRSELLDRDVFKELEIVGEVLESYFGGGFFRFFSKTPFGVLMYSNEQLKIAVQRIKSGNAVLHIDATGSVIDTVPGQSSKVLLYSVVLKGNISEPPISVADFISNRHTVPDITNMFARLKYDLEHASARYHIPQMVVVDNSWAMIHATNLAFNNMATKAYVGEIWRGHGPPCIVKVCAAHVLHHVSRRMYIRKDSLEIRNVIMPCIAAMIVAPSLAELSRIFTILCQVVLSAQEPSQESLDSLNRIKNNEEVLQSATKNDEDGEEEEDEFADRKGRSWVAETPYFLHFDALYNTLKSPPCSDEGTVNPLYAPVLVKYIVRRLLAIAPLWTGIATQGEHQTNSPVENWFKIVKCNVLQRKTKLRPGTFVRELASSIYGRVREFQMHNSACSTPPSSKKRPREEPCHAKEKWSTKRPKHGKKKGPIWLTDDRKATGRKNIDPSMGETRQDEDEMREGPSTEEMRDEQSTEEMRPQPSTEEMREEQSTEEMKPQPSTEEMREEQSTEEMREEQSTEEMRPQPSTEEMREEQSTEEMRPQPSTEEMREEQSTEEMRPQPSIEEMREEQSTEEMREEQSTEEMRPQPSTEEMREEQSTEEMRPQPSTDEMREEQSTEEMREEQNTEEMRPQPSTEEMREEQKEDELKQDQKEDEMRQRQSMDGHIRRDPKSGSKRQESDCETKRQNSNSDMSQQRKDPKRNDSESDRTRQVPNSGPKRQDQASCPKSHDRYREPKREYINSDPQGPDSTRGQKRQDSISEPNRHNPKNGPKSQDSKRQDPERCAKRQGKSTQERQPSRKPSQNDAETERFGKDHAQTQGNIPESSETYAFQNNTSKISFCPWGGRFRGIKLANTCTIDNMLLIVHLCITNNIHVRHWLESMPSNETAQSLLRVSILFSAGEFTQGKFEWLRNTDVRLIPPLVNLYGTEFNFFVRYFTELQETMSTSTCSNADCAEREISRFTGEILLRDSARKTLQGAFNDWLQNNCVSMKCRKRSQVCGRLCSGNRTWSSRTFTATSNPQLLIPNIEAINGEVGVGEIVNVLGSRYFVFGLTFGSGDHFNSVFTLRGQLWTYDGLNKGNKPFTGLRANFKQVHAVLIRIKPGRI